MARRVSMADVAAAAAVSGQTVSRVVNGSPRVDPATRARVEAAMARLDYRPHRAARALRTGRTHTIGLLASTLATVGNSHMLQAVADAAAARDFALTILTLGARDDVDSAFGRLRDLEVDGAIVLNEATAMVGDAEAAAGLPLVVVDAPAPLPGMRVVQSDHAGGARLATEHLLGLGHRAVWHLAGPGGSFAAAERERGWRDALRAAGIAPPAPLPGDWTAASGYASGRALPPEATAVFAANDQSALGLLRALGESGRSVPGDVSVVGFDDIADAADYRPRLTTIRQDFAELGRRAVEALVAGIDTPATRTDTDAPGIDVLPLRLVERASTAPPRRPAGQR